LCFWLARLIETKTIWSFFFDLAFGVFLTSRDKTQSLVLLHSGVSRQLTVLHVTHLIPNLKKVVKEMKKKKKLQEEETLQELHAKEENDIRRPVVDSKMFIRKQALFIRLIYVYFLLVFSATILPFIFAFIILCTEDAIMPKHICYERTTCSTHTVLMDIL
jgi:hypothetical protein